MVINADHGTICFKVKISSSCRMTYYPWLPHVCYVWGKRRDHGLNLFKVSLGLQIGICGINCLQKNSAPWLTINLCSDQNVNNQCLINMFPSVEYNSTEICQKYIHRHLHKKKLNLELLWRRVIIQGILFLELSKTDWSYSLFCPKLWSVECRQWLAQEHILQFQPLFLKFMVLSVVLLPNLT